MTLALTSQDVLVVLVGTQALALVISMVRLVRGPTLADRVVAYDLMATITVGLLALVSMAFDARVLLDVAGVLALVMFISTIAFARYIEKRS
ncbi:pesticidal protein Cry22Aa [bacterium]|nr:MAG: pesticidal protein Cry22Aa [bacterium]RIK63937.1 MAG: pesticidal protein Cry22Aa [Planctomycetota bacterium]